MEILWSCGEGTVRDVMRHIERPLAYTTVMTTLERLFKKGLLDRRRRERAFVYNPRYSREKWEEVRARDLVAGFFGGVSSSRELLISCLIEVVGQRDAALLEEFEKKVRFKRRELLSEDAP